MVGLFLAYKVGRLVVDGRVSDAFADADLVWHIERALRLPDEAGFQQLLLSSEGLIRTANIYYAVVHFPATVAFLLFMYFFRPEHYVRFRRMLAWLTAMGLVIHFVFPLAPPRMLGGLGLVDTAAVYGPSVYGPPQSDTLSNQYAAMPSLHVGWAIVVAAGLIIATRSRWRWLWAAHPVLTMIVVVGTANHYWIDGLVAGALVAGLMAATAKPTTAVPEIPINEGTLVNAGAAVGAGSAIKAETGIKAETAINPEPPITARTAIIAETGIKPQAAIKARTAIRAEALARAEPTARAGSKTETGARAETEVKAEVRTETWARAETRARAETAIRRSRTDSREDGTAAHAVRPGDKAAGPAEDTTAPSGDNTTDEPAVVGVHERAIRAVPPQVPHTVDTEPAGEPAR
ncbi:hypothetical protein GCM10010399_76050 [Dactylosporangium fulvum]|uniref:Phosphatase PAP2 family protein n=1 Tax=Dactylosporangium fulvum TaxID=53359 RepID=A0ABY5VNV0_9ACTN|nr:phosphatase PAP2 family protein [Dactylosporangium fulvum]UWP78711.1 phosphatase PAP2 family protein [Dactylosporangium fulvum]